MFVNRQISRCLDITILLNAKMFSATETAKINHYCKAIAMLYRSGKNGLSCYITLCHKTYKICYYDESKDIAYCKLYNFVQCKNTFLEKLCPVSKN